MPAPRTLLIVNPSAQNGQLGRLWPTLGADLRRELGSFEDAMTASPGDATRLAREAIDAGVDTVVAVGGDGTINEVVNGFFDGDRARSQTTSLAVLPFGTGGDFRKTVPLPRDTREAARVLAARHTRTIDVGHLELTGRDGAPQSRIFINIASFGVSGLVDEYVNQTSKRLGGRLSFMLATARAGITYDNQRVRLVFDGDPASSVDTTIYVVAVANGRYFGGGMQIAPDAELDDGQFDVVAMGDMGLWDLIRHGRRVYSGTHLELDKVSHRRARSVRAEPIGAEAVRLDVDGETPGILPASFRVLPAALRLVVPDGAGAGTGARP
ncbi:MAG TPA: diacylglycerol kinase family protein [Kofleriaceae bacterium]|nr:diacylglycerol kinase family protein [Kofleriaceae bacterium]